MKLKYQYYDNDKKECVYTFDVDELEEAVFYGKYGENWEKEVAKLINEKICKLAGDL